MYKTLFVALLIGLAFSAGAQLPAVASGRVQRFENFSSAFIAPRNVDVWLPDGYMPAKKYAVLYMHDGQMLFDSTQTWNKQEWGVDETVGRLMAEGNIRDCIVVGIWNTGGTRHQEYLPQKPFEALTEAEKDTLRAAMASTRYDVRNYRVQSDDYLRFLVRELKPFIDKQFSTRRDRKNTFIGGSSMGGLISLYALCEYPKVFGGAVCLSTHWTGIFRSENNPFPDALLRYLETRLPKPKKCRIYFDYGTETLDALYEPTQLRVDAIMSKKGFGPASWTTRKFAGADHSERAWRDRLHIPLAFVLRP